MDFCSAIFDWNKIKHADVVELAASLPAAGGGAKGKRSVCRGR